MNTQRRRVCDCPNPCGCYAEGYARGRDEAYLEVMANVDGPAHHDECSCEPCQVKLAFLQKLMLLMGRSSPALFHLAEDWGLKDWRGAEV